MKLSRLGTAAALSAAVALTLTACGGSNPSPSTGTDTGSSSQSGDAKLSGNLNGSGSSAQKEAQSVWAAGFHNEQPEVRLNYTASSSGQGRAGFQNGTFLFAGSDGTFKLEDLKKGGFKACKDGSDLVEIPVYISPIAIAFNVEGVDELNLDAKTIAGIFAGTVKNWNDEAIAAQNPGVKLPSDAIVPIHRSKKSGTTANFTDYLSTAAPDAWTYGKTETWPEAIKGGESAAETSNVAELLKNTPNTIGYLDDSGAQGLTKVNVKVGDKYTKLTAESAAAVMDDSTLEEGRAATDLSYKVKRDTSKAGSYPVILVSYLIGCVEYRDAEQAELVKSYFKYVVSPEAQEAASKKAFSAPISDAVREKALTAIDAIK